MKNLGYNVTMRIAALAAVSIAAVTLAAPSGAVVAPRAPHLAVSTRTVFTVRGTAFKHAERVTVTVTALGVKEHVVVRATRLGVFNARFPKLVLPRCPIYTVKATGSSGSHAVLRVRGECAPGPTP